MNTERAHGLSDVLLELIAASGEIGILVMSEICLSHRWILNGL